MEYLLYYSSSESEDEYCEAIERRRLRDKSNPLSLRNSAFIKRFRVDKRAFIYILEKLSFKGRTTTAVPAPLQLAATLSLLGSGGYQYTVGNDYLIGMSQSAVSKITSDILEAMEEVLCPEHIIFEKNWNESKEYFFQKYKIPGVIGCVDGTHIGMQKPPQNEHMFFNRKGFHSINSMIICNHEYRIMAVNSKYGGAAHDSFVWKHSDERQHLENKFNACQNENTWLLGDSGYPLEPWCITPYRNPNGGSLESNFNDVHSKARCIIERTIGILKGRWRILIYEKRGRYTPEKHARFGNVCSALHNICIDFKVPCHTLYTEPEMDVEDLVEVENCPLRTVGERRRNYIKLSL